MVRFENYKTVVLQLHLSRSTLQTDYINFTTKSKIISCIYHKRHQALCTSAVVMLVQLFCLCLLRKLHFAAPGDTRKTQIHATLQSMSQHRDREKYAGKNQDNHLIYYFAVVPLQSFHKHSLISHFGQGINRFGNQSYQALK